VQVTSRFTEKLKVDIIPGKLAAIQFMRKISGPKRG
jgi:hypothetical protein